MVQSHQEPQDAIVTVTVLAAAVMVTVLAGAVTVTVLAAALAAAKASSGDD